MDRTLLVLVVAHLVGDFLLQDARMVALKRRLPWLLLHVGVVTAVTATLLGSFPWAAMAIVFASHLAIDRLKIAMREPRWSRIGAFTIDQLAHAAVLVLVAARWPSMADDGIWLRELPPEWSAIVLAGLTTVGAAILGIVVGGHVIAMLTAPFVAELRSDREASDGGEQAGVYSGLRNGGRVIGWLERGLVLTLVLANQFGGVGFLIAAKSILRFGDIRDAEQRRLAEYVIIGTFMSFGWALLVAIAAAALIEHWMA